MAFAYSLCKKRLLIDSFPVQDCSNAGSPNYGPLVELPSCQAAPEQQGRVLPGHPSAGLGWGYRVILG